MTQERRRLFGDLLRTRTETGEPSEIDVAGLRKRLPELDDRRLLDAAFAVDRLDERDEELEAVAELTLFEAALVGCAYGWAVRRVRDDLMALIGSAALELDAQVMREAITQAGSREHPDLPQIRQWSRRPLGWSQGHGTAAQIVASARRDVERVLMEERLRTELQPAPERSGPPTSGDETGA